MRYTEDQQKAFSECINNQTQSTEEEHEFLFNCAQKSLEGCLVEIGSASGGSIPCLIYGGGLDRIIYSIDPYHINNEEVGYANHIGPEWKQKFHDNVLLNHKNVIQINKQVEHAIFDIKQPIAMVFIDGAHDYKYVYKDFWMVFHKVVEGGYICCHDMNDPAEQAGSGCGGVDKFVREVFIDKYFSEIGACDKIIWGRKR